MRARLATMNCSHLLGSRGAPELPADLLALRAFFLHLSMASLILVAFFSLVSPLSSRGLLKYGTDAATCCCTAIGKEAISATVSWKNSSSVIALMLSISVCSCTARSFLAIVSEARALEHSSSSHTLAK